MSKASEKAALKAESIAVLREALPIGSTITAVLRGRTSNGTSHIDFYTFTCTIDNARGDRVNRQWLSYRMAHALGYRFNERRDCITVPFMNMDQAFSLVNHLASILFPRDPAGEARREPKLRSEWL